MSHQNFRKKFLTYFILFGLFIILFNATINFVLQYKISQNSLMQKAQEISYIKLDTILRPTLARMDAIVLSLHENDTVKSYAYGDTKTTKADVIKCFYAVAAANPQIMQLRFLDANGFETIRIDREDEKSKPFILKDSQLQNKSDRGYFQAIAAMDSEAIWRSQLDLNIEHGKIEVPHRPTLRIAIPFLHNGTFKGTVIVNVLVSQLLQSVTTSSAFEHYIIDKEGFYLVHPNEAFSWNRFTNVTHTIEDDFSNKQIDAVTKANSIKNLYVYSLEPYLQNAQGLLYVMQTKSDYASQIVYAHLFASLVVIAASFILSIVVAFYVAKQPAKIQKELYLTNKMLQKTNDIIDKYVIIAHTSKDKIITKASSAFAQINKSAKKDLIGKNINIIKHPDTPKPLLDDLQDKIFSGKEWVGDIKNKDKNGESYWLDQHIIPITDTQGNITSFMSIGVDISAKKELEKIAKTDMLTGIYNRRKIVEILDKEIQKVQRYGGDLAVILYDIDHFKHTNDSFGHAAGDIVLKESAALMLKNIRSLDFIGRYGGEEFLIVCPQTNATQATVLANKLVKLFGQYTFKEVGHKTVSMGVASYSPNDDADSLIHKADVALYNAKENGRNQAKAYTTAIDSEE
jgi:diguanylate cyclase (GGDEF)-like protein/PAS domain S-box-containing protein